MHARVWSLMRAKVTRPPTIRYKELHLAAASAIKSFHISASSNIQNLHVECPVTYLLFVCAIRLESKMQREGDLIREAMLFYWVGANFQAKAWFFCRKPRSQDNFVLPRGRHFEGDMPFCDTDTCRRDYEIHDRP